MAVSLPIKLDTTEKKILAELDINCRISATKLARKVRKSREAVKYRIRQLEEKGVITGYLTSINPNKFGFYMFKVYLQLENIPAERERLYGFLRSKKNIYWYGICDGVFDCIFAVLSRSVAEYYEEINSICAQFRSIIIKKVPGMMVDFTQYNKKFLSENPSSSELARLGGEVVQNPLDKLDLSILDILANDARCPLVKIAHKAGSTIEIVRRRIRKMEEAGIIVAYRISIDLNKLGYEFFKAIVYFKSLSRKDELALMEWMKSNRNSVYYIRSLAPWEAEFEFVVENYLEFNRIISELRESFPHVIKNCEHVIYIEERWMPAYREL